ncbi:50S ribosomal protein L2, partial [Candidatus Microgenomates bacterium]
MDLSTKRPEKRLSLILPKNSGRDNSGKISTRHQGGRHKRYYRLIDFKRLKQVPARVEALEYDPNRRSHVALVTYQDGEKSYIVAPEGLQPGDTILTGHDAEIKPGNTLHLGNIPIGTLIHNIEIHPGKGAKLVRSAGSAATVLAKEETHVQVKFPSGEIRRMPKESQATIGQVGNINWRHEVIGKAGRARHMGKRPEVRGVAQNPRTHPHGGGEGRSGVGMVSPKSPWGKRTMGTRTRKA